MLKFLTHIAIGFILVVAFSLQLVAQRGTSPVGVNFIIVNFNQPPTYCTVSKAPLKYNKDFALSMQIDDADITLFTHGYPVFEGGEVNSTTYPGFFYSDGCENAHNFKMSSSVFVFMGNNLNGPDIHLDNSHGQLSWDQMDTIYNHGWGILNHGVNGDPNTDPYYSISRNKSYVRRKLYNTTEGGVMTHILVNPNGFPSYTQPAFDLGNISALNQNILFPIGNNGGNVNAPGVDWTQPYNLYRNTAEDLNVTDFVDGLADSSVAGANYWCPIFTHSLVYNYQFNTFVPDFTYIANTYGINGLDNILMTSDEEIQDYLIVRDRITVNYVFNGTSLMITFSGEVPDDLLFYSTSLIVNSDATINNIVVDGTDDFTFNGIGDTTALINLNWDGYYVIPPEQLGDSMVTVATASQTQFDCWIAMDYVITMTNGAHKDSLRQVLCDISGMTYDEGFCECEISIQPADTTIGFGDCIDLFGAEGEYTYEWFIGDSLVDTVQDIYTCPIDTTQYNHIATNTFGCPAEDSIMVNINFLSFDLGPDTTICEGDCVTITGPPDMAIYNWFVADTLYDTVQIIVPCPVDTTQYTLWVEDGFGATAEDSIVVNVLPAPTISFEHDSLDVCLGNDILLTAVASPDVDIFIWYYNGHDSITQSNTFNLVNPDTSDYVYVGAVSSNNCTAVDSTFLSVLPYPEITVSNDTAICCGDSLVLSVSGGTIFLWTVDGDTISTNSTIVVKPEVATNYVAQTAFADSICYSEDTVKVTVHDAAHTKILYDTNIVCTYVEVTLTASGADHYLWTPGGDTGLIHTFTITDTTTVWLTGTTNNGCQLVDSTTFYNKPSPQVSFTGLFPAFCDNDPGVVLTGIPSGGMFAGNGIVGNKFYPQSAGPGMHEIVYSYTNPGNCIGYDTNSTTVYGNGDTIDLGPDFTLHRDSSSILDAGAGFDSYYWTTGATTQSITVFGDEKTPGIYEYAVMGVIHGCSTRGSVNITFINPDGYPEQHINDLTIFPNPNGGSFSIKFSSVEKDIHLGIFNLQGKLLYERDNVSCNDGCKTDVHLNGIEPGFYFLTVTTPKGVSTAKIILR